MLLFRLQSQSARQRKRQAEEDAEQAEAERALWRILFSGRPSAESMREAERGMCLLTLASYVAKLLPALHKLGRAFSACHVKLGMQVMFLALSPVCAS